MTTGEKKTQRWLGAQYLRPSSMFVAAGDANAKCRLYHVNDPVELAGRLREAAASALGRPVEAALLRLAGSLDISGGGGEPWDEGFRGQPRWALSLFDVALIDAAVKSTTPFRKEGANEDRETGG